MQQRDAAVNELPAVVRVTYRFINTVLVSWILIMIVQLFRASFDAKNPNSTISYLLAYVLVLSMGSALLLVVVLLVHALEARTLRYLKWPFMLFTLNYLVVTSSRDFVLPRLTGSDTTQVRVVNRTGVPIHIFEIAGRGAHATLDSLPSDSAETTPFRGRAINFQAGDPYSNRVSIFWYAGGKWHERCIVDPTRVIRDSLIITFPAPDSVTVAVR
jgi:hypothetical protein